MRVTIDFDNQAGAVKDDVSTTTVPAEKAAPAALNGGSPSADLLAAFDVGPAAPEPTISTYDGGPPSADLVAAIAKASQSPPAGPRTNGGSGGMG
jgi:hypothetical protein